MVFQAHPLRDAETRRLGARFRVQQTCRNTERQKIVVGDPVVANKLIFGVNAGEIEVIDTRIVVGQKVLVPERRKYVKRTWLKRLAKRAAKITGIALEHQATVQAEGRHHPAGRGRAIGQYTVELVVGDMQLQLGRDEPSGRNPGPAHLGQRKGPPRVGLTGQGPLGIELGGIGID